MRILALQTTERIGGVAAMDGGKLLCELDLDSNQRSAQSLTPGIRQVLDAVGWRPADIQLVATCIGPGSFTGLRVGVTAAKTLAYSVRAEVVGVDTLEVIAAGAPSSVEALSVAVDAQRGQVVAGSFRRTADAWLTPESPTRLVDVEDWLAGLAEGTILSGPVLRKLIGRLPQRLVPLDPQYWPPTAASVARLAQRCYAAGRPGDLWTLAPRYSRPSAAEEKWEQRG